MGQIEHELVLKALEGGRMICRDIEIMELVNSLTPEELLDISLRGYIYSYRDGGIITEIRKIR